MNARPVTLQRVECHSQEELDNDPARVANDALRVRINTHLYENVMRFNVLSDKIDSMLYLDDADPTLTLTDDDARTLREALDFCIDDDPTNNVYRDVRNHFFPGE